MPERVSVRHADFDLSAEVAALREGDAGVGAVVAFVGTVRDHGGAARRGSCTASACCSRPSRSCWWR
jgi:molybdopterin synthase catalytic subunit